MAIVLDADVLIRGEKGSFDLARWLATHFNDQFEVAAITVAEPRNAHTRGDQKFRLYIAFVYGLGVLGQKQAKRGKRRIAENVATTRAIKTSTTGPNSLFELQNRSRNIDFICPATLPVSFRG